jgi:hypothetical protein
MEAGRNSVILATFAADFLSCKVAIVTLSKNQTKFSGEYTVSHDKRPQLCPSLRHSLPMPWRLTLCRLSARDNSKEPAVISTKPMSIHTTQFYKAFIDIWPDTVTDPITEHWLSFVICELKPALPTAEAVN